MDLQQAQLGYHTKIIYCFVIKVFTAFDLNFKFVGFGINLP